MKITFKIDNEDTSNTKMFDISYYESMPSNISNSSGYDNVILNTDNNAYYKLLCPDGKRWVIQYWINTDTYIKSISNLTNYLAGAISILRQQKLEQLTSEDSHGGLSLCE